MSNMAEVNRAADLVVKRFNGGESKDVSHLVEDSMDIVGLEHWQKNAAKKLIMSSLVLKQGELRRR